ncbi:MAG: HAD hydrolase family protein [Planctomycetes bacterium]|nr:HAD hydrolase family protein [Planctomycetota bacterium]
MRYRMIGIDLDGTLLDRHGKATPRNLRAIAEAERVGVLVVPCTGRAWRESRMVLSAFPRVQGAENPGVFVGGAVVSDLDSGKSMDIAVIEPTLALELIGHLHDNDEAVLVFRDANLVGHDYMVTGRGTLSPNTEWWFQATGATVHFHRTPALGDLHHVMRVGLVTDTARMNRVTAGLRETFGDRVLLQSFAAVQMPDPRDTMHVLEVFARGVDKWRGLSWIAAQRGIETEQIAVIGDEVNDLAMVESAGLGIAMGNAIEAVKAASDHVTLTSDESGVGYAIEQLLSGRWG